MKFLFGACLVLTLAAGARPLRADSTDTLVLRTGDSIQGRVVRLANDNIQFFVPSLAEALTFSVSDVARIELAPQVSDAGSSRLVLNTGAEVSGKIVSMSEDAIVIASSLIGRLSIPRKSLVRITNGFVVESHFEKGELKPWIADADADWECDKGILLLYGEDGGATLELRLHQDSAVTLIAEFEPPQADGEITAGLFVGRLQDQDDPDLSGDDLAEYLSKNSISLLLSREKIFKKPFNVAALCCFNKQRQVPIVGQRMTEVGDKVLARFKMFYDPSDGTAQAWYNDKLVVDANVPDGVKKGEYIVLRFDFGKKQFIAIRRLAVHCHALATDDLGPPLKPGEVFACLSNGDTLRASALAYADGNLIFTTAWGPVKIPAEKIRGILFPAQAAKPPEGVVTWIKAEGARFPLEIQEITDEAIIGKSRDFGQVKIARKFVKSIVFPAAPAP